MLKTQINMVTKHMRDTFNLVALDFMLISRNYITDFLCPQSHFPVNVVRS